MSDVDFESLWNIVIDYAVHMDQYRQTLLPCFLGLLEVSVNGSAPYKLVVMTNFFAGQMAIHRRYDLKGSCYGRYASATEKLKGEKAILKDMDWVNAARRIVLPHQQAYREFIGTLTKDTDFLRTHNLMDYSLLIGVCDRRRAQEEEGEHYRERKEYMRVRKLDYGEDVMYIGDGLRSLPSSPNPMYE